MDKTDRIKKELIVLFDEMLDHRKEFRRKQYAGVIEDALKRYESTMEDIMQCFVQAPEEEREALTEELAQVIPNHAYEKMQSVKKRNKDRDSMDYNLNMAVYVVPLLNYSKQKDCIALTKRMVELWNGKGITNMHLTHRTYDEIAAGFERKLCYITTAVCESMKKPDDCYELRTFRDFRDGYLMETEARRELIEEYYEIAPGIVMLINMQDHAKDIYESIYKEYLAPCLKLIEKGKKEACLEHYVSMMCGLKKKYLYA